MIVFETVFSDFKMEQIIFLTQKTKIYFLGLGVITLFLTVGHFDCCYSFFSLGHTKFYNNHLDHSEGLIWMHTFNLNLPVK